MTLAKPVTWGLSIGVGVDWKLGDTPFKATTNVALASDGKGPLTGEVSGAPSRNLIARSRPSTLPASCGNGFTTVL